MLKIEIKKQNLSKKILKNLICHTHYSNHKIKIIPLKNLRQYGLTCHSLGTTDSCSSHINNFGTYLGTQYFIRNTCTC